MIEHNNSNNNYDDDDDDWQTDSLADSLIN